MKRTVYTALATLVIATALPSLVQAQLFVAEAPDGTIVPMQFGSHGELNFDPRYAAIVKEVEDRLQVPPRRIGDGRRPIIVLDSVRVDEATLQEFAASLRAGKVRIRKGGIRVLAGDDRKAAKYGARVNDKVIIISTESTEPVLPEK